jgi:hypothetical protein
MTNRNCPKHLKDGFRDFLHHSLSENVPNEVALEILVDLQRFRNDMRKKYPDSYGDYLAYHILAGSTPGPGRTIKHIDFPENEANLFLRRVAHAYFIPDLLVRVEPNVWGKLFGDPHTRGQETAPNSYRY